MSGGRAGAFRDNTAAGRFAVEVVVGDRPVPSVDHLGWTEAPPPALWLARSVGTPGRRGGNRASDWQEVQDPQLALAGSLAVEGQHLAEDSGLLVMQLMGAFAARLSRRG